MRFNNVSMNKAILNQQVDEESRVQDQGVSVRRPDIVNTPNIV